MNRISKFEIFGILASVVVMAFILNIMRAPTDNSSEGTSIGQNGDVIQVEDGQNNETALERALREAVTLTGELKDLVITDIETGSGSEALEGDTVVVHYTGITRDGVQFDSSYTRNAPFTFTIGEGRVIEGWERGVPGMKVGGQRILIIPPEMGYGNRTWGPIEANSVLIFAVELIEIK